MTRIVLAFDGSASAIAASHFAIDMARRYGAELCVVAVARPPEFGEDVETKAWIERAQLHLHNVMQPLKEGAVTAGVTCRTDVVVGHPSEQIVRYAESRGADHIVVGHRGHTLFERFLIGSVARQVIAYANCAVTVVRSRKP